jgi:hypothetical protein
MHDWRCHQRSGPDDDLAGSAHHRTKVDTARYRVPYPGVDFCRYDDEILVEFSQLSDALSETTYWHSEDQIEEVNAALLGGSDPDWRRDRRQVFNRWFNRELRFLCDGVERSPSQLDCRFLLRDDGARYRLQFHNLIEVNQPPDPNFEAAEYEVTVEQLGGGPGWWVTGFTERRLLPLYSAVGADATAAWETFFDPAYELLGTT